MSAARPTPEAEPARRVVLAADVCEANGLCVGHAPEVFWLGDDDTLTIDNAPLADPGVVAGAVRAVNGCPKQALSWLG